MRKTTPCVECKKPVRRLFMDVAGDPYTIVVDPMPTLQGIVQITNLVTNEAVLAEPGPYQYAPHKCWEEANQ